MREVRRRSVRGARNSRVAVERFKGVNTKVSRGLLPLDRAECVFNYRYSGGALEPCYGVEFYKSLTNNKLKTFPMQIWRVWYYDAGYDGKLIIHCADGYFYQYSARTGLTSHSKISESFRVLSDVTAINYRFNGEDVMIFTSLIDSSMYIYNGTTVTKYENVPRLRSMAIHYERLFSTTLDEPYTLWFSDDFDPTCFDVSLTQAGFIEMADDRGELLKVISFLDYIYIFRAHGITRVTAYGDQSQFSVTQMFTSCGRIFGDTVAVCGDRVIFLASDGLYSFDGLSTRKILSELDGLFMYDSDYMIATYFEGKYYLACKLQYGDAEEFADIEDVFNNTLIVYGVNTGEVSISRGFSIRHFAPVKHEMCSKLAIVINSTDLKSFLCQLSIDSSVVEKPLRCLWRSGAVSLGYPDKVKSIKSASLISKYGVVMRVITENGVREVKLVGRDSPQRVPINVRGKTVQVEFEGRGPSFISDLVFDVEVR